MTKKLAKFPTSAYFNIEELADGVFAAIAPADSLAMCNAGIIDLGDRTVVFDTFLHLDAAQDLYNFALELTGNKVHYVINSHFHTDHIVGNQLFTDATIISSPETREKIAREIPKTYYHFKHHGAEELAKAEAKLETVTNDIERTELLNSLYFIRSLAGRDLMPRFPDLTFTSKLTLSGSKRSVDLINFPVGHTPGDVVLHLPEEGIIFMGDLLVVQHHPWLGDGNPDELVKVFDQIEALEPKYLVPGHGPVGTLENMQQEREYIEHVKAIVHTAISSGKKYEEITVDYLAEEYTEWDSKVCFRWNAGILLQRLNGANNSQDSVQ